MSKALRGAPLAAASLTLLIAAGARSETLSDAIALAYQSNPTLQGQRASLRALDETYVQAEAGYRPSATLQATVTTNENNAPNNIATLPGGGQQIVPGQTQTSAAGLSVTQPLYTGGRVATQISAAQASILAGRETLRGTEESLLQNVITAYVDVRRDQQAVAIAEENLQILKTQLAEIKARFGVGEITRTDVAQTEANVAAAEAQHSAAQAQLANSRANYASIVGQNPGTLALEPPLGKFLPATLDQAFETAERNSPQIRQARYTEQSSAAKVAEAKAQTRPTLSLQGNFGYVGGQFGLASPFVKYSHDVTASAVAVFPIFTGGTTSSQIRQAAETDNADRIGIEISRRQVLLTVSQAWNQLLGARASLAANEAQVQAANIAFEGTRLEARAGLRTTLDVLITEQNLSNAQTALITSRHDEYVAGANLLAATGSLFTDQLTTGVAIYDPKVNLDRVRHSYPWAPWSPAVSALDHVAAPKVEMLPEPAPTGR
jgi:outer membrane protein